MACFELKFLLKFQNPKRNKLLPDINAEFFGFVGQFKWVITSNIWLWFSFCRCVEIRTSVKTTLTNLIFGDSFFRHDWHNFPVQGQINYFLRQRSHAIPESNLFLLWFHFSCLNKIINTSQFREPNSAYFIQFDEDIKQRRADFRYLLSMQTLQFLNQLQSEGQNRFKLLTLSSLKINSYLLFSISSRFRKSLRANMAFS